MDRSKKRGGNPAGDLTDDLVVEILSRLPAKSVCRFKCVSRHWLRGLITHPAHRKKLPQTLSGFFYRINMRLVSDDDDDDDDDGDGTISSPYLISSDDDDDSEDDDGDDHSDDDAISAPDFASILPEEEQPVSDPSLSFLPGNYRSIVPKHCLNGLLLCLCWKASPRNEADYVVCNPATEKWVTVPGYRHRNRSDMPMHLGFDPAALPHFHVFALLEDEEGYITGVDIYSSETDAWSHEENDGDDRWADDTMLYPQSVFLHGMLHLVTLGSTIVAVDTEGKTWRTIPLLESMDSICFSPDNIAFIGKSQGRFHYVNNRPRDYLTLSVWILDDDDCGGGWIFRYNISTSRLFGCKIYEGNYNLVAIHPECNMIFFTVRCKNILLSYDMDRGEVRVIGDLKSPFDGWSCNPYLPYVPSFSRAFG